MDSKVLLEGGGNAAYAPPAPGKPGSLVFYFQDSLMAQPFDTDSLTLSGGRTVLAPEVLYYKLLDSAPYVRCRIPETDPAVLPGSDFSK